MTKVYRIENKERYGLYSGDGDYLIGLGPLADADHPTAWKDPVLKEFFEGTWKGTEVKAHKGLDHWEIRFGFSDAAQLHKWLYKPAWLETLDAHGWVVGVYDAYEAKVGETQAVFNLKSANRTGQIRLTEI